MRDWADLLRGALDAREAGLADAIGLKSGMSSDEFERALGAVLQWSRLRVRAPQFFSLTSPSLGRSVSGVRQAYQRETNRLEEITEAIRESLISEFGRRRIDPDLARAAYDSVVGKLSLSDHRLIIATTNYDPSAEVGLELIGVKAETGFRRPPAATPTLEPQGFVSQALEAGAVPVLHLHGAVGWYEKEGTVRELFPDLEYSKSFGTPAVLYPDPEKDPTRDAMVQTLWTEFESALAQADRVLVCGHSLNDPVLVRALRSVPAARLAVSYDSVDPQAEVARRDLEKKLPGATTLPVHLGPNFEVDLRLGEWLLKPVVS